MSEIRVENIIGETGVDAVKFTKGINVTGIVTATNVSIGSSVTATSFFGSGAGLSGVSAGKILQVVSTTNDAYAAQDSVANTKYDSLSVNVQITPSATSSKILLFYSVSLSAEVVGRELSLTPTVNDGSSTTEFALGASQGGKTRVNTLDVQPNAGVQRQFNISFHCQHSPNTTSQRTYGFRHAVMHDGAWIVRNQAFTSPDNANSARSVTSVTAMEVAG